MAVIMKKKLTETIRKVNVKLACSCPSSSYVCDCGCTGNAVKTMTYTAPEAEKCAESYYYKYYNF